MAKSLIKTWKKFVPESAEKKEKKKEEKEKSKEDKNGAEDDPSAAGLSSGPIGDKGSSSFPPRPQPTSDQEWHLDIGTRAKHTNLDLSVVLSSVNAYFRCG